MRRMMWLPVGMLLGVLPLAACEVSVGRCDDEDGGKCGDDFPDWDGGTGMDAARADGGEPADGSVGGDAAIVGMDGGPAITVAQFCRAQLATAVRWRDLFDGVGCGCTRTLTEQEKINRFLSVALAYSGDDPEGSCINVRNASLTAGRTQFVGQSAAACASKFAGQFVAPPTTCPVDLAMFESQIAHGAQQLAQLPECRAAFVGRVARDGACTQLSTSGAGDSLECQTGLRCLPVLGAVNDAGVTMTTCQPARGEQQSCSRLVDCADGLVCAGSSTSGRVCIPGTTLRAQNGECSGSFECIAGLVCRDQRCVSPTAESVCGL